MKTKDEGRRSGMRKLGKIMRWLFVEAVVYIPVMLIAILAFHSILIGLVLCIVVGGIWGVIEGPKK